MNALTVWVGIDTCKANLNVHLLPQEIVLQVANTKQGQDLRRVSSSRVRG